MNYDFGPFNNQLEVERWHLDCYYCAASGWLAERKDVNFKTWFLWWELTLVFHRRHWPKSVRLTNAELMRLTRFSEEEVVEAMRPLIDGRLFRVREIDGILREYTINDNLEY